MKVILIGDQESKRTEYFTKAAEQSGVFVCVMGIEEVISYSWGLDGNDINVSNIDSEGTHNYVISEQFPLNYSGNSQKTQDIWIKVDPCSYESCNIEKMNRYINVYQNFLNNLPKEAKYHYLNSPKDILEVLDKRKCKKKLIEHQVPVTPLLAEKVENIEQLHYFMKQARCNSVFLKPVFGSGAVGIAAYRWNWNRKQSILYTSCKKTNGIFLNTKKIHKITDKTEIKETLKMLFALDVIVEKWLPKAQYQGKSYDLRVVYQFGKIDYIVARQSNGPMTNLHLNNQALNYRNLNLSSETMAEIESICRQAMKLFPRLTYAGIDILLDKKEEKPYIIEINGQGDCVYQDMYEENCIYQAQINHILENSVFD